MRPRPEECLEMIRRDKRGETAEVSSGGDMMMVYVAGKRRRTRMPIANWADRSSESAYIKNILRASGEMRYCEQANRCGGEKRRSITR